MKKLAMSFLSELSATWLKRRAAHAMPSGGALPASEKAAHRVGSLSSKRVPPKVITRPKPPSPHDIASNM